MIYVQSSAVILSALLALAFLAVGVSQGRTSLGDDLHLPRQVIPHSEIKADSVTVVGASWCAPCQQLKPRIAALHKQGYDVRYVDIKDWEGEEVSAFPTSLLFREDTLLRRKTGLWSVHWFKQNVIQPL